MSFRTLSLTRAGSLAAALALGACAGTGMDDFDPAQIRIIAPTEATSTCIGDPRTPVCAVETFLACIERRDKRLCQRAVVFDFSFAHSPAGTRYQVLSSRILREEDVPPEERHDDEWMLPSYAEVVIRHLTVRRPWCPNGCEVYYSVKPMGIEWKVTAWMIEGKKF
jgi:hypothetical protein